MSKGKWYATSVEQITISQIPRTKEWLSEIENEFNVEVSLPESGKLTMKAKNRQTCDNALAAMHRRIRQEDFQNALEIAKLIGDFPCHEQFSLGSEKKALLSEEKKAGILHNQLAVMGCVLKIDHAGHVSIFGNDMECTAIRNLIEFITTTATGASITDDNNGKDAETTGIANAIDAVMSDKPLFDLMEGELADEINEELSQVDSNTGKNDKRFNANPVRLKTEEARPFGPASAVPFKKANEEHPFGADLPFKEEIKIPRDQTGRVIGKQSRKKMSLESRYNCRITVKECPKHEQFTKIIFAGSSDLSVKRVKEEVLEFLKSTPPWERQQSVGSGDYCRGSIEGSSSCGQNDAKGAGEVA